MIAEGIRMVEARRFSSSGGRVFRPVYVCVLYVCMHVCIGTMRSSRGYVVKTVDSYLADAVGLIYVTCMSCQCY